MRERLIEPIVIEHVGMAGNNPVACILTHYDDEGFVYTSEDGHTVFSIATLDNLRRGIPSWLRIRKSEKDKSK